VVKTNNGTIMRRTFKFYKTEVGRWYVDLPEWEGSVDELEMVAGADLFLELLSQGEETVFLTLSTVPFEGSEILEMKYLGTLEGWEMGWEMKVLIIVLNITQVLRKLRMRSSINYDWSFWRV